MEQSIGGAGASTQGQGPSAGSRDEAAGRHAHRPDLGLCVDIGKGFILPPPGYTREQLVRNPALMGTGHNFVNARAVKQELEDLVWENIRQKEVLTEVKRDTATRIKTIEDATHAAQQRTELAKAAAKEYEAGRVAAVEKKRAAEQRRDLAKQGLDASKARSQQEGKTASE